MIFCTLHRSCSLSDLVWNWLWMVKGMTIILDKQMQHVVEKFWGPKMEVLLFEKPLMPINITFDCSLYSCTHFKNCSLPSFQLLPNSTMLMGFVFKIGHLPWVGNSICRMSGMSSFFCLGMISQIKWQHMPWLNNIPMSACQSIMLFKLWCNKLLVLLLLVHQVIPPFSF